MNRRSQLKRMALLSGFLVVALGLMVLRLVDLQIVNGATYREKAQRKILRTYDQPASRGEILDCYGRPLVSNTLGFSISFDYYSWEKEEQNQVILDICAITQQAGLEHYDTLPITTDAPFAYTFASYEEDTAKNLRSFIEDNEKLWRIPVEKEELKQAADEKLPKDADTDEQAVHTALQALSAVVDQTAPDYIVRTLEDLSAPELMELLREKYDIDPSLSDAQARLIAGVRYEMDQQQFSSYNNLYTFASQVDVETVSLVEERSSQMPGVTITVDNVRQYDTTYASHVLGRVGKIYREEYEELKDQGYGLNDTIGKDGLEKAYESYLRGIDGEKAVETNINGDVINETETKEPQPGSNVILTLDLDLQAVAEESLASTIQSIKERGQRNHSSGWDVEGGAAVVIDIDTGGILACASYPTYNLATFNQDYQMLYDDPLKPMFNRATMGAYPPGSTFKPVTALAALESGTITTSTKIRDEGVYTYYASSGYTPACWIWNDKRGTHGLLDVSGALKYSCNYFFFEASRLMGIDTLNYYAKQLGLGQKTGVELPSEAAGNLAGPESREKNGETWWPGETLQAAIGQSEQQFTPIQMANYMATILNGGTRYRPHFLKQVVSYDYTQVVEEYQPEVLAEMDISESTIEAIKEGMRGVVTDDGTAASVFRDYPIAVGGKTGSAQTTASKSQSAHGVFISFAPYDDPQIAVFVLVEHGGSGGNVAPIVRDIYDAYFGKQTNPDPAPQENTLIY